MPMMPGKTALLELLKQEGVRVMFGNPGHDRTAADGRLRRGAGPSLRAGACRRRRRWAWRTATPRRPANCAVVNLHAAPGLGNAMGMLYDAQKAGVADPGHRRPARAAVQFHRTFAVGRSADDRAAVREMVGGGAAAGRSAARHPSRREDRAGAADGAGVSLVARRHPDRQRRPRPGRSPAASRPASGAMPAPSRARRRSSPGRRTR